MRHQLFEELFGVISEDNAEALWASKIEEHINSGKELLVTNPDNGWSLLHYASENLFSSLVLMLLNHGIPVDIKSLNGSTPYLVALDASIDAAIQNDEPKIEFSVVKLLVAHGADTESCSVDGISRESLLESYGERATQEYIELFS